MNEHATAPVETPADTLDEFETVHLYPRKKPYRKSGARIPQPGDVARCGWVKQNGPRVLPPSSANCLMCIRLRELAR